MWRRFMNDEQHWHLDKRVPLALIVAIIIQSLGAVWWAGQMDERVAHLEALNVKNGNVEARLVRIEEGQSWIKKALERILNTSHLSK